MYRRRRKERLGVLEGEASPYSLAFAWDSIFESDNIPQVKVEGIGELQTASPPEDVDLAAPSSMHMRRNRAVNLTIILRRTLPLHLTDEIPGVSFLCSGYDVSTWYIVLHASYDGKCSPNNRSSSDIVSRLDVYSLYIEPLLAI